jgi:DNA modification methylase
MPYTTLLHGDCLEVMPTLAANSIDSIVCDPPYGLSFMGRDWDHGVPGVAFWAEALRVAKPGAMLLAFGGTRTFHRLTVAIEDAGWEIRDCLTWLYGSGFPKSMDISKAIDKAAGVERNQGARQWSGGQRSSGIMGDNHGTQERTIYDTPVTDEAKRFAGWGTALKPAAEMIVRAIKPFPEEAERDIIVGNLCRMEAQLWLLLHVSIVGRSSMLSQAELDEVLSIAQWSADNLTSTHFDLCGPMDTSQFASMVDTCLSIVTSWKSMLADLWSNENTSTISTVSSLTIDSKTLSYLLSLTTLENIIQAEWQAPGSRLSALPAAKFLNAVEANISSTRMLSALGSATYGDRTRRLDATADPTPNWEPIIMAMKPIDGTFANNALVHGVAGLNVDACRIGSTSRTQLEAGYIRRGRTDEEVFSTGYGRPKEQFETTQGRWPANLLLDEEAARLLDEMSGERKCGANGTNERKRTPSHALNTFPGVDTSAHYGDTGGASRFFYVAKASKRDRDEGLEGMEETECAAMQGNLVNGQRLAGNGAPIATPRRANHHPTVKPTQLMRYLCRLVTRPNGVILDPFMGSGSTGKAAMLEGFNFVGIELDAEYLEIARRRIEHAQAQPAQAQPLLLEAAD